MADDTKLCPNCKRDISAANFVMHEMHCRRHIVLCEHCDEPIHRTELEQHFNESHAQFPCERCQQKVSKPDMEKHLADECIKRPMRCEFCELSFPKDEFDSHLDYCGSRTEPCPLCQQYIMLKDMLKHENSGCTYPEPKPQSQPPPPDPYSMEELQHLMNGVNFGSEASRPAPLRKVRNPTNKKTDVNVQRARNLSTQNLDDDINSIPPDLDYDTMLALQLAHEDWLSDASLGTDGENVGHLPSSDLQGLSDFTGLMEDNMNQYTDFIPDHSLERQAPARQRQTSVPDDDDIKVPCEFCEQEIPISTYMDHAETCPLTNLAGHRNSLDLNNELSSSQQTTTRAAIPVINNLRSPDSPPRDDELFVHDLNVDQDIMLPCEFCEDTFPSEIIIEHQSVCQANGNISPRATTPVFNHRNRQSQPPSNLRAFKPSVKTRPKRQPDPSFINFATSSGRATDETTNRDLSNIKFHKVSESSSNKYSPAVDRFDDALTRPPRRPSRQLSQEEEEESEVRRPSKSAQRVRARLDQMLQDDLGNGATGGADNNSRRKQPIPLGGHDLNRAEQRRKKVDSRTVMQQLEEAKRTSTKSPSKTTGRNTRTSSYQSHLNSDNNSQVPNSRNRQRSDHVFSPELRLKPDHNPPPKKR